MDNASKALVMAGSVLIAVAIISVAVYAFATARGFVSSAEETLSATQIQSFNRFYIEYRTTTGKIRGIDAINILNRALEDGLTCNVAASTIKLEEGVYTADSTVFTAENMQYSLAYDAVGKVNAVSVTGP